MTYSVVALSRDRRYLAAAAASYSLAVGNAVPAVAPGIAAVVTQAYTNKSFRHHALAGARRGRAAGDIVTDLADLDAGFAKRQVGIITADGATASHSGADCSAWTGSVEGDGFVVLGNLLDGPTVVKAMAEHLQQPRTASAGGFAGQGQGVRDGAGEFAAHGAGAFAALILETLEAGQEAGGDARGQQSAALVIAANDATDTCPPDLLVDLRVDDSPAPLTELRRLLNLWNRQN